MRLKLAIAAVAISPSPSLAWDDLDRMKFSGALAEVLGSEEACGLSYRQDAIAKLIEEKVPADDMEFSRLLSLETRMAERDVADMNASSKTAHCTQIKRVAKTYGLVE